MCQTKTKGPGDVGASARGLREGQLDYTPILPHDGANCQEPEPALVERLDNVLTQYWRARDRHDYVLAESWAVQYRALLAGGQVCDD